MDRQTFEKIISQIKPMTDQVCLHLMGDPLVHPRLKEFVEICENHQVPIFFVTNGVLLKDQSMDLLLHPIFRQLNFSLHSFFDNFPGKDPTSYLEKIFKLTERAFTERPDLYINFRLWNLNDVRGSLTDNTDMLKRIEQRFGSKMITPTDVRKHKSIHLKNRLYLHYDTEFVWPDLNLPKISDSGTCYGLTNHFGILADGTVVPCCLDKEGKIPLGSVHDQTIRQILQTEKAQSLLNGFKKNKLINPLCQRCNYVERFT